MRLAVTILFALLVSVPAAGIVAVLLAEWTRADEAYLLVFMAIAPAALLASAVFLYASARGGVGTAARAMLAVLAVGFVIFSLFDYLGAPAPEIGLRGVKLMAALALTLVTIVLAQGLVFRGRERRKSP